MSITTIDPKTALVAIDLQAGLRDVPAIHPVTTIATRTGELAAAFRERDLPVVLVNVVGVAPGRTDVGGPNARDLPDGWSELLPELGRQDGDHTVSKERWGAFHRTGLYDHLAELGVTQVVLTGVSTSVGVESTARAAYDHGLHVTIATDAVTDTNPDAHANSIERIFPKLGETGTVEEIIAALPAE